MSSRWRLAVATVCLALVAAACRQYLPTNRYLQPRAQSQRYSTSDARGKFDHAHHASVFAAHNVSCLDCHRFDTLIDAANDQISRELSVRSLYPGGEACHYCHRPSDTKVAGAPAACTTCHQNLAPLLPPSHEVAWQKVHASAARADATECANCHAQSFCIDCHERRDTIQTRVHERNFRFTHSVEVRANPMQCSSCHRQDFCIACHQRGKVGG